MFGNIARRLKRLEAALKPPAVCPPHVLTKRHDETIEQALTRFVVRWGAIPRKHRFLVVPPHPRTAEERAKLEVRFKAQQTRIVAEARSHRSPLPTTGA